MTASSKESYADLERKLEACVAELAEERAYQLATSDVLRVISESPSDLQPVFDTITERAMTLCDARIGGVSRFDGEQIHLMAYHGVSPEAEQATRAEYPMSPGRGRMLERAIVDRVPVQSADVRDEPGYTATDASLQGGFRSVLAVPMLSGSKCVGSIVVAREQPGLFSDKQIKLLQTFADQAVIAIENVRLFNETQEALEQQMAISDVLRIIGESPSDLQPVFDVITERAMSLCDADAGSVTRFDGEQIHMVAYHGISPEAAEAVSAVFPMVPGRGAIVARAIDDRAPVQSTDVLNDPDYVAKDASLQAGLRNVLAVPMLSGGKCIGSIGVGRAEPGVFSGKQIKLLQTFADQAVIAIENARLFNETQEALERQTATAEILRVISSSPTDVQPVFDAIAERAASLSNAEWGIVTRYDGELAHLVATRIPQELEVVVQNMFPTEPHPGLMALRAILEGEPVQSVDFESDYAGAMKSAMQDTSMRSALGVPMLREGRVIGSIAVGRNLPSPFSDKQINLLESFADQAVIAIENVRLFNETQEALERQTATAEILSVISSSPTDVQPVFDAITERAVTLCNAEFGFAVRFDGELMHIGSEVGLSRKTADAARAVFPVKPGPNTISGRAVLERKPVQIPDVSKDAQYMRRESASQSMLSVPLIYEGQVLGAITVGRPEIGLFPDNLVDLLKTFAEQAVIAIENVRLFNETQEALEQQTASSEILRVISESPTDIQPVFDAITARAIKLCNAKTGAAMRFDGEWIHLTSLYGLPSDSDEKARTGFPVKPGRNSLSGRIVLERAPLQIVDLAADIEYNMEGAAQEVGSCFGVPLMREGQVIGVLVIAREQTGAFPEKQINLLKTFADQAVIAVENVRLFNETQEALEQQTASSEILRVISESPTDVQPVFDAIAERAMTLCSVEFGVATRFDGEWVHLTSMYGPSQETMGAMHDGFPMKPGRNSLSGRAILEGVPVQIVDIALDPEYAVQGTALEIGSGLSVPLIREGQVIGALTIGRKKTGPFSDKLVTLLQTFAEQAVIALQNVHLFNETQEALEQQTAISEVLRVISESPTDVQPVFDAITERAIALCNADVGVATRFDGELMHLATVYGLSSEATAASRALFPMKPGGNSISGRAVLERAPVQSPDLVADRENSWHVAAQETGSVVAVPLMREGRVVGAISVGRKETGMFPGKLVSLLQTFADQAVIAIENVRLFNETQEALEQQTASSDILRVISESPTDVQPVFDAIAERAMTLCNADIGIATRFDGESIHLSALYGPLQEAAERVRSGFPVKPGRNSLSGRVVLERAPVQIPDIHADQEFAMPASAQDSGSCFGVPLMREGLVVGTLMVARKQSGSFPEKQIKLLQTFADQAVIAIQNVRLFNETQEALEQQTAISDILRVITESPTDVQPILEALADRAADLCEAAIASIYLTEGDNLHHVASRGERADQALEAEHIPIDRTSTSGRAIIDRKTIHVEDMRAEVDEFPRGHEFAVRMGHRTVVVAPLLREGKPFGTILLRRMEVRPFSDRELALLRTFGDQAAIALENVRLFNETTEALEHQTAAAEVLRVISSSVSDTAPVFEKILDSCERLFESEQLVVLLVGEDDLLHIGALRGALMVESLSDMFPIPLEQSFTAAAFRDRCIVHIPNVGDLDEMPPVYRMLFDEIGNFTNIIAPMLWEGRGIGSIVLTRYPPRAFSDKEIVLLETFAEQAVIAIQNARLFNETKEALEQQTATAEVLSVISSSVADTAPVFEKILDSCERLFASEQLAIMLVGEDGLAHVGAFRGQGIEALKHMFPLPLDQTFLGVTIQGGRPVHYPDIGALAEMPTSMRALYERVGNFSIVIAPMLWEGQGVGSISVNRYPPKPFSDKEIALLATFADQAVIAIENARLFHEIEEKSRQLEIADQHKSEFLANMSHELRTPLNAIIGFSEVLIERMFGELNEKQDDYLKDIYSSGKHLLALINDILDLSKIEAGRMELDLESFDVDEALTNTLTLIRERAQQHGIALDLDTGTGLGEMHADQRKLKQIMLNLLSNAVKFTPDGGSIDVHASRIDGVLEVAVTDTGIGIAEPDQETIFQEFRQVGGDYTNKQEGTGLGLALTKRFVELHGGTLSLISELGTGSTFTFTLPDQS